MDGQASVIKGRYFSGAPNFRDMGGYVASGGLYVRHRCLYRSDGLHQLTEADLELLAPLHIRMVCDFRDGPERKKKPSRWPTGGETEWMELDISTEKMGAPFGRGLTVDAARQAMTEMYRVLPGLLAPGLGRLCERLVEGAVPALIHCTAGKDRTGVICASMLRMLGVSEQDIYADYMLSDECNDKAAISDHLGKQLHALLGEEPSAATIDALVSVSPEYLHAAFAAMVEQFGSFDAYLELGAGIDATLRRRMAAQLLA